MFCLRHAATIGMLVIALPAAAALAQTVPAGSAAAAPTAPGAGPSEFGREVATGGLSFVQDPAIVIDSQDVLIARNEIKITYVMRNTTNAERSILAVFPLPEIDTASIGDQGIKLADPKSANFVAAVFSVDGAPPVIEIEQRALAMGLDVTGQLAAHQVSLVPFDPDLAGQLKRLPKVTKVDFLQRGILRTEDDRVEPNWTLRTAAYWRQGFPARKPIAMTLSYRPVNAVAAFQPALLEAARSSHCLTGAADVAVTRKVAAQAGKVTFTWTSFVPGPYGGLLGTARQFKLRIEKPSIDTVVVTCRGELRPLGPTALEWTAQNYADEELRVLFVD